MSEALWKSLDEKYAEGAVNDVKNAAYKTVATFAGLTKRKLWLKDATISSTNGYEITAPFNSPFFYQHVEHELAHILFETNLPAKKAFVARYTSDVDEALMKGNVPPLSEEEHEGLRELIDVIVGVLEDARIESLWGLLYPGSHAIMGDMHIDEVKDQQKNAHRTLASFCVVGAALKDKAPKGEYERYLPFLLKALERVKHCGFTGTLVISKWLLQQVTAEHLRKQKGLRAQPKTQQLAKALASKWGTKSRLEQQEQLSQVGTQLAPAPETTQAADLPPDAEALLTSGGAGHGEQSTPAAPEERGTLTERGVALKNLLSRTDTVAALFQIANDVKDSQFENKAQAGAAQAMVNQAMNLQTSDDAVINEYLEYSETRMRAHVDEIRDALGMGKTVPVDDWLVSSVFGKVKLKDVAGKTRIELAPEDAALVQQLRSRFYRVMGRKKFALEDFGAEIDVSAYIEGLVAHEPAPCFKAQEQGRGFKILLLIDRSSSMGGEKTESAERACRVLSCALKYPFVDLHVWGFQAPEDGETLITRFDKETMKFTTKDSIVDGNTPLHHALRVGVRFMEMGDSYKQLVVLTDGHPSASTTKGKKIRTETLLTYAQKEIEGAKKQNIHVSGVLIGKDMSDSRLSRLFGPRNWVRLEKSKLNEGLITSVVQGFTKYLRG